VVVVAPKVAARPTQATIVVELPADATLYVDNQRATVDSSRRTIVTPDLEAGKDYFYTLKGEVVRDGKKVEKSKRIVFRAGQEVVVKLDELNSTTERAAARTSRVTVRLPEDARLYVDGTVCPLTSGTRSFETPALEPGRSYYYTLKAEVTRDGQPRSESKRVMVQAGTQVDVSFGGLTPVITAQR
jgi:uncharacterized protein (TIGR03000 family)